MKRGVNEPRVIEMSVAETFNPTSINLSARAVNKVRALVEEERIPHDKSTVADYVTVSQGVITIKPETEHDPGDLIKQADNALYEAKDSGRNAISVG